MFVRALVHKLFPGDQCTVLEQPETLKWMHNLEGDAAVSVVDALQASSVGRYLPKYFFITFLTVLAFAGSNPTSFARGLFIISLVY